MASKTEIANLALVPLLGCNRITNIDDDQTEAVVMNAAFDFCRDSVLEERAWTFATNRAIWTPTADAVPFGFTYSYIIPSTVLRVLDVDNGRQSSTLQWRVESGRVLSNIDSMNVIYIEKVADTNKYNAGFNNLLAIYLAWYCCMALTQNRTLKDSLWAHYQEQLTEAISSDGQQGSHEITRSTALTRFR